MSDEKTPAGAMPVAGGAMPPQTPPAPPAAGVPPAAPPPSVTGDPEALGDAGKRALDAERARAKAADDRAKAAEKALADLQATTMSESEKAIADAKKAGATEVQARFEVQIRRSEVRAALMAKGIRPDVLDLAVRADEFAALKVTDDGQVEKLDETVEAFIKARGDLFKAPVPAGTADGGTRGTGKTVSREQIKTMTPAEINAAFDRGDLKDLLSTKT